MTISAPLPIREPIVEHKRKGDSNDSGFQRSVRRKLIKSTVEESRVYAFALGNFFSLLKPLLLIRNDALRVQSSRENSFKLIASNMRHNSLIIRDFALANKASYEKIQPRLTQCRAIVNALAYLDSNWKSLNNFKELYHRRLSMYVMKLLNSTNLKIAEAIQGSYFSPGIFSYIEDLTYFALHLLERSRIIKNPSIPSLLKVIDKLQFVYSVAYPLETLDKKGVRGKDKFAKIKNKITKIIQKVGLIQRINDLSKSKNDFLFLSGGSSNHGVLYKLQSKNGSLQFTIINTGEGAPDDNFNQQNYTHDIKYIHLSPKDFPELFLQKLLLWQISISVKQFNITSQNHVNYQIDQQLNKGNNRAQGRRHHVQNSAQECCLGKCIASAIRGELNRALLLNFKVFLTQRELNHINILIKENKSENLIINDQTILKKLLNKENTEGILKTLYSFRKKGRIILKKRQDKADRLNASVKHTRSNPK